MKENQAGYIEMEWAKEREERRERIEMEELKRDQEYERFRRKFGHKIQDEYNEHRIALQTYGEKLTLFEKELLARESTLRQTVVEIESRLKQLEQREKDILRKEEDQKKKLRDSVKEHANKKKKEIQDAEARSKDSLLCACGCCCNQQRVHKIC